MFTRTEYLNAIGEIQGTDPRRIHVPNQPDTAADGTLRDGDDAGNIFLRLRRDHPAPFAAFIDRGESQVVSASPERFFEMTGDQNYHFADKRYPPSRRRRRRKMRCCETNFSQAKRTVPKTQ